MWYKRVKNKTQHFKENFLKNTAFFFYLRFLSIFFLFFYLRKWFLITSIYVDFIESFLVLSFEFNYKFMNNIRYVKKYRYNDIESIIKHSFAL